MWTFWPRRLQGEKGSSDLALSWFCYENNKPWNFTHSKSKKGRRKISIIKLVGFKEESSHKKEDDRAFQLLRIKGD